ncbi:MAG: ABC transporter transmembrane domain-containing protein, partial [Bacteroidia bacterium]
MAKRGGRGRGPSNSDTDELPKAKLSWVNLKKSLRLFSYLHRQKWKFLLGMFFLLVSAGVGLIFPIKSGDMFGIIGADNSSTETVKAELYSIGYALLFILVAQSIVSFLRVYLFAQVTESILKELRVDTFRRLVQMPMGFFSKNQV